MNQINASTIETVTAATCLRQNAHASRLTEAPRRFAKPVDEERKIPGWLAAMTFVALDAAKTLKRAGVCRWISETYMRDRKQCIPRFEKQCISRILNP